MNILHICTDKNVGGAGRWIETLAENSGDRYTYTAILPTGSATRPLLERAGVTVVELPIADRSLRIRDILPICRAIKRLNPDIVHTHGSLSGRIAGRLARKPIITTRHWADLPSDAGRSARSRFGGWVNAKLADVFIATARVAADNLAQSGVPREKIVTVLNGTNPVILPEDTPARPHGFTIGMLARLEQVKGHKYLLNAVKPLVDVGYYITVLLAGTGSLERALKDEVAELELEHHVEFLGFLPDPALLFGQIDVQVNASHTETTCLALLEGMSAGVPTIASAGGGTPDVIMHEDTGLLFPVGDVVALAECVRRMIDDDALRRRIGQRGRETYESRFTGKAFADQVCAVYAAQQTKETAR